MASFEMFIITCDAVGFERGRRVNSDRDMRSEARRCGSGRLAARAFKDSVGLWSGVHIV
jgi:hypothetical protein